MGSLYNETSLKNIHVFMVSFPGQGHVNPLLRLGKRLAASGLLVTLSTSDFMGQIIRKSNNITSDDLTPVGRGNIRFEFFDDEWAIEDPNRESLDAYLDQLELVGREKLPLMIRKHEELGRPVTCVINNPFIPWVTDVADSLGIPSAMLWVQSCACFSAYYHFYHKTVSFPNENDLEIEVQLPNMPLLKHDEVPSFLHPNTPYPFLRKAILGQFKNLDKPFCVLMDTFEEFEHEIIESISKLCGPIKAIGPLFMSSVVTGNSRKEIRVDMFTAENDCIEWLDTKPESSVVYISFGSIVYLKQEQVDEIAYGLLESGVNFLWVLRPPPKEKNLAPHVLPSGFLEKMGERGKVVGWSPQEAVLAHPSTACFMTHCGWNSTLEAVASGVPVVAFPQWGDQVTDAKFLVDIYKVGIRMCRGEAEGRIVGREEVASCLKAATGSGEEIAEIKRNVLRWKKAANEAVADGGSSDRNMRDFVDEVVGLRDKGRKN